MKTIAVISQKGGSGKTTTLVNLAVAGHLAGQAILVVDLDLQASATDWHRARSDKSPHVQPTHPAGLRDLLHSAHAQGVDLVFIDTAAKTEADTAEAIEAADLILVTCRPTVLDLRAMRNSIRLCRIRGVAPRIILTQTEPQGATEHEARRALEQFGVTVLAEDLGRRISFQHAAIEGLGVCEFDPQSKAAFEVRRLYKAVCHLLDMPSRPHDGIASQTNFPTDIALDGVAP